MSLFSYKSQRHGGHRERPYVESYLYSVNSVFLRPLRFAGEGFREAQIMMDAIVGIIGVILIIYLFATIIRPEKF
ncbi:potassium-transporting ATPase subunit F [Desulforhabdus amnigena]|uniref:K(+)-transporting ATPase subunit F n=1 Tax=Desulforhabdus amnigena TaxID=40218 RepID=A0A9W6FWP2_9BACT|nr:hypothetical protein DAMNIGENAA_36500 [Desulforhabdus amnigena]